MKKCILITLLSTAFAFHAFAQKADTTNHKSDSTEIFEQVDEVPVFPGGVEKLFYFIQKNLKYPRDARSKNIQGKALVTFVVEKDGSLTNIVVNKSPSDDIAEEALRIMKLSPKWQPARQNGIPVRVQFTVPIVFSL